MTLGRFQQEVRANGIRLAGSHDSYLVNLASPDSKLLERSVDAFRRELDRCTALGLDFVVTHPGNATDGDRVSGLERNADALIQVLAEAPKPPKVLLELTAGAGHALGCSFRELAAIIRRIPAESRDRIGVCVDTCHAFAAGYDLVNDYRGVWDEFEDVLGLDRLGLFHLNDSKGALGSRKDRHENIAQGTLGSEPFRRIMTDPRFLHIPKIIETPKGKDPVAVDLANLRLLRSFRQG
jgi:deoxyribonuclease-4